jgi:MFS family permease
MHRRRAPGTGVARIVAGLALANGLAGLLQTFVLPVQAELPTLLGAPRSETAWVVTAAVLAACVFSPIVGRLADLRPKRQVAGAVLGLCAIGSLVCAVTTDLRVMSAGRFLQGFAITFIPLSIAILHDVMPPRRLGPAIAAVSAGLAAGSALGLPFGGIVAALGHWRLGFWTCLVLAVGCLAWLWKLLPFDRPKGRVGRFDLAGALGMVVGVTALLVGATTLVGEGVGNPYGLGLFGLGVIATGATVRHMARAAQPIIDVRGSFSRPVLTTNAAATFVNVAMMTAMVGLPQVLSMPAASGVGLGLSLVAASAVMTTNGLSTTVVAPIAGRLSVRHGPRSTLVTGACLGAAALAATSVKPMTVGAAVTVNIVIGAAFAMTFTAAPQLLIAHVPKGTVAAANGLQAQLRIFGTATGSAVAGAILAASAQTSPTGSPTAEGFRGLFILAALASAAAWVTALLIPTEKRQAPQ